MKVTASVIVAALAASGLFWAVTSNTSAEPAYSGGLLEAAPSSTVAAPATTDRDGRDPWNEPLTYSDEAPQSSVSATVEPEPIAEAVATAPAPVRESLRFNRYEPAPQAISEPRPRYSSPDNPVQAIGMDGEILTACLAAVGIDPNGDNTSLIDEVGQEVFDDMLGACVFGSITQG